MGRDDHRHGRFFVALLDRAIAKTRQRGGGQWIAGPRPRERAERAPEKHLRDHGANRRFTLQLACRAPSTSSCTRARGGPYPPPSCDPIQERQTCLCQNCQRFLTDAISLSTESFASPNSITVFGLRNSGFSLPAKPGFMLRFNTTTCWAS